MKLAALGAIGILATACQAEPPMRVHETIKNIHVLNGKTVRVAGYLGNCGGYECLLFENRQEKEAVDRWSAAVRAHNYPDPIPPEVKATPPDWLGIGGFPEFDKRAQPFANSYVVITGKLSNRCRDEQLRPGCTDRAPELEPSKIEAWTPPEGRS